MKQSRNPLDDITENGWQVLNFDSKSMNSFQLWLLKQLYRILEFCLPQSEEHVVYRDETDR
jgi:hypothetical protein